jgi:hypothetical protein
MYEIGMKPRNSFSWEYINWIFVGQYYKNPTELMKALHVTMQVDLRHADEKKNSPVVDIGIDLSEFYQSVEWDILEVPAERYIHIFLLFLYIQRFKVTFVTPT